MRISAWSSDVCSSDLSGRQRPHHASHDADGRGSVLVSAQALPSHAKVAVVTGAARGIGRAIAPRLARDGAAVSAWDLRADGVAETVEAIRAVGGRALVCIGDVCKIGRAHVCTPVPKAPLVCRRLLEQRNTVLIIKPN